MDNSQPYISVVVAARNDDHGGNLLGRMQAFAAGWIAQSRRYDLSSELIVVEWNPPADRPRLRDALSWPEDFGPCRARFIEVPLEVHSRYAHAEALPLYQMIAKNVGIRRARGQFILATNIDILFSGELVAFLAERRLDSGRMYRIDRHDAMSDLPLAASLDEQLEYCRSHVLRINSREGTFLVEEPASARSTSPSPLRRRKPPFALRRKLRGVIERIAKDGPLLILTLPVPSMLQRVAARYVNWGHGQALTMPRKFEFLHTNGCGDFTLVARKHWFDLRGYPEFDLFSMNIDSVFCYAAHYGGVREEVLPEPMRIYHIEHAVGSGWTPEGQDRLFKRVAAKGLGFIADADVMHWATQMRRLNSPMIFNHEDWGLANCELAETEPSPADRAPARVSAEPA